MAWHHYDDDWGERESRARRLERQLAARKRRGEVLEPILPAHQTKLSNTFWGQAWNRNLESYADYEHRLPRGRSYLRGGHVHNLEVDEGEITSLVIGQELYEVRIDVRPLEDEAWESIRNRCSGRVGSLLDLIGGKLGDEVMAVISNPHDGLFPKPKEMKMSCTCPDWAGLCKHLAATLYGVGCLLDVGPELLFLLRGVDPDELVSAGDVASLTQGDASAETVAEADLSALFGIELDRPE